MMALNIKNVHDGGFKYIDISRSEHKTEGGAEGQQKRKQCPLERFKHQPESHQSKSEVNLRENDNGLQALRAPLSSNWLAGQW